MVTKAPSQLWQMYRMVKPHVKSMAISGIVGDTRHVAGGGYHISREDLRAHGQGGDYSIQAPADRRGPADCATAIDMRFSTADMKRVSGRLKAACEKNDNRIEPIREFIGTVDGKNVCGYNRYRTGRRTGWYSSGYSDSSHLWHVHISFFRDYCDNLNDVRGVAEVVCGLPAGALGWKGDGPVPNQKGFSTDMATDIYSRANAKPQVLPAGKNAVQINNDGLIAGKGGTYTIAIGPEDFVSVTVGMVLDSDEGGILRLSLFDFKSGETTTLHHERLGETFPEGKDVEVCAGYHGSIGKSPKGSGHTLRLRAVVESKGKVTVKDVQVSGWKA